MILSRQCAATATAVRDEPSHVRSVDSAAGVEPWKPLSFTQSPRDAFEPIWQRYASTVHAILISMVPEHEADDLMQEVALSAYEALPRLRKPESFPSWVCTIARNIGRDALKRRRRSVTEYVEDLDSTPSRSVDELLSADRVMELVRSLPRCYAETLTLRLVLDLNGPEIARRTGRTPGSVRVNLHRGFRQLRAKVEREFDR